MAPLVHPLVHYRAGYRFQLAAAFECATPIRADAWAGNRWVQLLTDGRLLLADGYAWDGASGPIAQTPDIIRGSLVHDALYQLMRECGLSPSWRPVADQLLREMCVTDGMPRWHADIVHAAVVAFGAQHIDPTTARPVLVAPAPVTYPSTAELIAP